jgi:PAS domain S-box-containing protein
MLGWAPDRSVQEALLEERVEADLKGLRATQLVAEEPAAEAVHLVLIAVVLVLIWPDVPRSTAFAWVALVVAATFSRFWIRHRLVAMNASADYMILNVRRSAIVTALAWSAGAVLVIPQVDFPVAALILVVFAGLAASGIATLLADSMSFYGFMAALLVPLGAVIVVSGEPGRERVVTVLLLLIFAAIMVVLYRRSYKSLVNNLRTLKRLELTQVEIVRERGFLDALFSSAPTGIATVDGMGRIKGINPRFEQMFGYTAAEAIGRHLNDLIVPESAMETARSVDQQLATGASITADFERMRADGELISIRASAAAVEGMDDGTVLVMYDDITAVKQAEDALRRAEEQYRQLVESASDLVWQVDVEGRWTFLNAASERIYGIGAEQLLGHPFEERTDSDRVAEDREAFASVLSGAELAEYQTVHRSVQGDPKHLGFSARPVRDADGTVVGARGIARDISESVAARDALERAREVAEQTALAKSAFLANMSHEIRTPMNAILGMTELLLDTELTLEQRKSASLVRSSAEALLTIINDILDFSKIEAGRIEIESIPFDLHGMVDTTVRMLAVGAFDRGVELAYDIHTELPRVLQGDAGRLRQVLNNLIGNALKFTSQGEVVVSVSQAGGTEAQPVVRFAVRDTGIGIPPEKVDKIFEQFSQADVSTTRVYGGTGLGLTIVRRLVEMMGGSIDVDSVVGEGSTFSFGVPLGVASEEEAGDVTATTPTLEGVPTLVVDDNPTNRQIVRDILESVGTAVSEAGSGEDGIEAMKAAVSEGAPFKLLVLDVHMPGMDGFQVAEAVRGDDRFKETRVMILTSGGHPGDGQRCRDLGVAAYLPKPVSRLELLEAIDSVLGRRSAGRSGDKLVTRHLMEEGRRKLHILVAEDNAVNQQVAAGLLGKRGHRVEIVENGRLAVEAVTRTDYDVVLMDVQMPELDGVSATREIRQMPGYERLPIVALTAHALSEERERCLAAGMTDFLSKPFRPHDLIAKVEGLEAIGAKESAGKEGADVDGPVDLARLQQSMAEAGAEEIVEAMLQAFTQDAPGRMQALEEAIGQRDADAVAKAAHAFKSAAGAIEAARLAQLLKEVEIAGREEDVQRAVSVAEEVREEYESVTKYLGLKV